MLGGGIEPRVLFPSARGTRSHEISEDEINHFTAILESHETSPEPPKHPSAVTDIGQTGSIMKEEIEKVEKITHVVGDEIFDGQENYEEETKTIPGAEEKNDGMEGQQKKRARAPSVAPSVSSVASSNILSFGRRPRITKSVSSLSYGEGKVPELRRSKRLCNGSHSK